MKQSLLRRCLSLLLCLSILLGISVARPQRADAFAISASVVASVILIMTACGVSFWASTQGDAESYISQKLGEYLDTLNPSPSSILDWLGIQNLVNLFTVVNGGVVRFEPNVANPILGFVRWFNQNEGVESGGESVGAYTVPDGWNVSYRGDAYNGSWTASLTGLNTFTVSLDGFSKSGSGISYLTLTIPVSSTGARVQCIQVTNRPRMSVKLGSATNTWSCNQVWSDSKGVSASDGFIALEFNIGNVSASGTYSAASVFSINENIASPTASVTPSSVVAVPNGLTGDEDFDVMPSVGLTQGSSVDDATDDIMDGVVSQDGLSSDSSIYSPPLVDLSGIESRLDAIEAALIALDDAVDSVDGDTSDIQGSIATLLSRASSIQDSITTLDNNLDSVDDNVNDVGLAVAGISGKIDNLESDVAGLVGSLGSISQGNSDIQDSIAGLSSAMAALSEDMELVKDALSGLTANDSLADDVSDIKTNTTGLSGFLSSIQYYVERVVEVLLDFFSGFFDNLASAFIDLINSLKAMLLDLFIPEEAFVDAFVADLQFKMDNHFSILSYPFSLLGRFIGESALQTEGDGILSWPDIYEPFSHTLLIHAGSYRLFDVVDEYGPNFYRVYDLYRIVLQGYITFDFISYLYFWFCDVFKMRELDFANPLEDDE